MLRRILLNQHANGVVALVRAEFFQHVRPHALLGAEHDADAQHAAALLRAQFDGVDMRIQVLQHLVHALCEFLAVRRKLDGMALALQQFCSQFRF